ncbi:hypothetical protein H0H81_005579 [Sphagnurus paluster]|uniref:Heterokaryon incompatibility domain-containing protein n=1 Tax=Sphagnurus paluster TaxID=117069 RepID=A0A9P7GLI1_9AGAR|nr:hypothetical protein H0H81_005579 [Sphagnurus paluster]
MKIHIVDILPRTAASYLGNSLAGFWWSEFRHKPLRDAAGFIRLVTVLPPTWDHMVHCSVEEFSLDSGIEYEALSYTWFVDRDIGKPIEGIKQTIICNGGTYAVNENLYDALLQLQDLQRPLPIWIDAISINQVDDDEKSAQVNMMHRIFGDARSVFIWLGRKTIGTRIALHKTRWFFGTKASTEIRLKDAQRSGYFGTALKLSLILDMLALHWIIGRGFFERVWTMQEVVLAKEISFHLGNERIPLEQLAANIPFVEQENIHNMAMWGESMTGGWMEKLRGLIFILKTREQYMEQIRCPLPVSIAEARRRQTTKPADKVFAILSMSDILDSAGSSSLRANYRKNVPKVYLECARELFRTDVYLNTLSLVGQLRWGATEHALFPWNSVGYLVKDIKFVEGLPSWVPDLSTPVRPVPLHKLTQTVRYGAALSLERSYNIVGENNSYQLQLKAAIVDVIKEVGDTIDMGSTLHRPWYLFEVMLGTTSSTYMPTGEPIITAFRKTLVGGERAIATLRQDATAGDSITVEVDDSHFSEWFCDVAARVNIPSLWRYRPAFQFILSDTDLELTPEEGAVDVFAVARKSSTSIAETSAVGKRTINVMRKCVAQYDAPEYRLRERLIEMLQIYRSEGGLKSVGRMGSFEVHASSIDPPSYKSMFEKFYLHRRFFVTEKGYMGTGPWTVSKPDPINGKKDVVMLVAGAPVPYIFRQRANGCYELVGEAYCHGAMGGSSSVGPTLEEVPGLDLGSLNFSMITVV